MTITKPNLISVELHLHTCGSGDSRVKIDRLLAHCEKIGLDKVAITDHNSIEQAKIAHQMDPDRVIIGEEIETTQGELLGYFLTEWVPPNLSPLETIKRLRDQGAVISVSHPFEKNREPKWTRAELEAIVPHIDAIEVFNARCLTPKPNQQAGAFAKDHNLAGTAGSDAHSMWEVGRAILEMADFEDAAGFKTGLENAKIKAKLSPAYVHLFSRFAFYFSKIRGFSPEDC